MTDRIFYLLAVPYGRLQDDDDDVTVPLLSASKGRQNEENLTGLPNPCSLSIGGGRHTPSYAYQITLTASYFCIDRGSSPDISIELGSYWRKKPRHATHIFLVILYQKEDRSWQGYFIPITFKVYWYFILPLHSYVLIIFANFHTTHPYQAFIQGSEL